jgi:hypothetical protein
MEAASAYNTVILVRSGLDQADAIELRTLAGRMIESGHRPLLIFFHAEAAALDDAGERRAWASLADAGGVTLAVCRAARGRRSNAPLPAPFQDSSLVQFWASVLAARQLVAPKPGPVKPGGLLLRMSRAMAQFEARDCLELVLAAASLDLDLVVWFEGAGLSLLEGPEARGWLQLLDHGLARLVVARDQFRPGLPPEPLEADALNRCLAERTLVES